MKAEFDYGDGGAFPEYPYAQYPLDMGLKPKPMAYPTATGFATAPTSKASGSSTALVAVNSAVTAATARAAAVEDPERVTEETRDALNAVLAEKRKVTEDFSGRRARVERKELPGTIAIVAPPSAGEGPSPALAPIVRSPTKAGKTTAFDLALAKDNKGNHSGGGGGHSEGGKSSTAPLSVPFAINRWRNKKKLVISVDERLAQEDFQQQRELTSGGISQHNMDLALAMHEASKDIAAETTARQRALAQEEERRQAALEAEEAERARQLLEANAARVAAGAQRHETREQRRERIRLDREMRERERAEQQRQRLRERAAARRGMTLEALEADAELLRLVDSQAGETEDAAHRDLAAATVGGLANLASGSGADGPASLYDPSDEGHVVPSTRSRPVSVAVASGVVSAEGIQREMQVLAALERDKPQGQADSGRSRIKPAVESDVDEKSSDDDDDDDAFGLDALKKKRRRLM